MIMPLFKSPAKINLFLRILGKRDDRYHEMASLFQALDFCDLLEICPSSEDIFQVAGSVVVPVDGRNLAIKARDLFRKKTGDKTPFSIALEKVIPIEAGFGGGSSNAATVLFAMNQFTGGHYAEEELSEWSSEIGSDIPFFFSSGIAYCTGRGEKVRSLEPLSKKKSYSLFKPPFGLSTPLVYQNLDLSQCFKEDPEKLLSCFLEGNPIYTNDLEGAAFKASPELKPFKESLLKGFHTALMTGSGSAFFGVDGEKSCLPPFFIQSVGPLHRTFGAWY